MYKANTYIKLPSIRFEGIVLLIYHCLGGGYSLTPPPSDLKDSPGPSGAVRRDGYQGRTGNFQGFFLTKTFRVVQDYQKKV